MPTVAAGNVAAHNLTLVANTVTTVDFADNVPAVEIISDGTAAVYYSVDGSTPTVGGANCYMLPAGFVGIDVRRANVSVDSVKLISTGTPTVSVQRGA